MNDNGHNDAMSLHERAERSIQRAFAEVVAQHRRSGLPLVVLRKGKVVHLKPSPLPAEQWQEFDGEP